ncbi:MAG TPA: transglycosylase SLT domain-containing protein [Rhizobiaceae bacterium]|nr:transglycosylase SLT domain-containing protein [Rhizobiaceae bacterium]
MTVSAQSKEAPKPTTSQVEKAGQETSKSGNKKTVEKGGENSKTTKSAKVDSTVTSSVKASAGKKAAQVATGGEFGSIIARYAAEYGVPAALAHAVIRIESNYRVKARGSAGEIGLMQIKPSTARMLGYSGSVKDLYTPEINIKYGMKYLGMAQELSDGSTCGTILKYNAGHAAKRMNPISAAYCAKVKKHLAGA